MVDSPRIRARRSERARKQPPHIVLFFIDNVQANQVGAYGYEDNPTTPNIDALAKRGALFRRAYSNYPQTRNFASQTITGRSFPEKFDAHGPPAEFVGDFKPVERTIVLSYESRWRGAIVGRNKLIEYRRAASLFDLAADPLERTNLADARPDFVNALSSFTDHVLERRQAAYRGERL
ncbi:MAG: sulfatase-like hydrolase/transferase [Pseudomonadota bacterium]